MQFVVQMMNKSFLSQLPFDVVENFKYATIDAIMHNGQFQVFYFCFWENMQFDKNCKFNLTVSKVIHQSSY